MQREILTELGKELAQDFQGSDVSGMHRWAANHAERMVTLGNSLPAKGANGARAKAFADAKIFGNLADALQPFLKRQG